MLSTALLNKSDSVFVDLLTFTDLVTNMSCVPDTETHPDPNTQIHAIIIPISLIMHFIGNAQEQAHKIEPKVY